MYQQEEEAMSSRLKVINYYPTSAERLSLEMGERLQKAAGQDLKNKLGSGEIKLINGKYVGESLKVNSTSMLKRGCVKRISPLNEKAYMGLFIFIVYSPAPQIPYTPNMLSMYEYLRYGIHWFTNQVAQRFFVDPRRCNIYILIITVAMSL